MASQSAEGTQWRLEGAVASWPNPAGLWCQKGSEIGAGAPAMVASQPGPRS